MKDLGYGSFDQLIITEYLPGKGLKPHLDRLIWGPTVIGISLVGSCLMDLESIVDHEKQTVLLTPGSLYRLSLKSRYCYTHGIQNVSERRISLTFRTLSTEPVVLPNSILNALDL